MLQWYMNREIPDVWIGLRKGRGTRDQIANICWVIEKAAELKKNLLHWLHESLWLCGSQQTGKFLEMGMPGHFTCLLRNCMQIKKQQLEPNKEQWTGSKLGKESVKAVYCHPAYLTSIAEYIMWNARLDESQPGIKTTGRNVNNIRNADDTTLMAESEEELKSLLIRVKEESERSWLKTQYSKNEDHGIQFHHFMAKKEGKSRRNDRFYFLGLQNHCSQEIKRCCSLEGKL